MKHILHQVYQRTLASWLDKWQKRKARRLDPELLSDQLGHNGVLLDREDVRTDVDPDVGVLDVVNLGLRRGGHGRRVARGPGGWRR